MVCVGAIIFHDLFNQRIKNVEFSWKEVLSFEGTKQARLYVTNLVQMVLKDACGLLGMECPEKM